MTDRELRRLGRRDLLELLVALGHERDALKAELENRQLKIDRAGSIAEAALQVNGVFESAQAAAELYLDNVRERTERVEEICAQREAAAQADAERIRARRRKWRRLCWRRRSASAPPWRARPSERRMRIGTRCRNDWMPSPESTKS